MSEKQTTQEQAARRIAGLLANAEDAAQRGDLAARDTFLQKATALQHKYAVDQVLLEMQGEQPAEDIEWQDFCEESNTPLIKAKRELVSVLASLYRGTTAMVESTRLVNGKWKRDKRAAVRVWAHASDLAFIGQLYTSFILQMQTEMARDERLTHENVTNGWRVSYAHGWVYRVWVRLKELNRDQEQAQQGSGAELVLRSKGEVVRAWVEANAGVEGKARRIPTSDKSASGRAAGDAAGRRADLGQKRVAQPSTQALE